MNEEYIFNKEEWGQRGTHNCYRGRIHTSSPYNENLPLCGVCIEGYEVKKREAEPPKFRDCLHVQRKIFI